ncbi:MAG: L-2-amino-thiazoline-4-carboxylic acid hydrolase [Chloroflexi bacterium]|nr:L-2-amino-thiazoline-4-carboxylic acid hydrolase [Chloroflexota bacterium]
MGPGAVEKFIRRFWELTGEDTARMYIELGKLQPEDLSGLVRSVARSSEIMGEDAEARVEGDRAYLIHHHCPWPENYRRFSLPETCQGGCDTWFQTIAARLSPRIRVKTTKAIPAGDDACVREFWIEE